MILTTQMEFIDYRRKLIYSFVLLTLTTCLLHCTIVSTMEKDNGYRNGHQALIAVIMNEPEKKMIIKATAGNTLVGPESIRWEIGNAFSAMLKRNRIVLSLAQKALSMFEVIPIRYLDVDFNHSLKLAHDNKIYAYDAYFLDCAIRHKTPLITLDGRMKTVAKNIGINVVEV